MVSFNMENNPRSEGHFELGELVIAPRAKAAIPKNEIDDALARHLRLDFGKKSGDEILYNFTAITFGAGVIRSCYTAQNGKVFLIHTDQRGETPQTRVFLPRDY